MLVTRISRPTHTAANATLIEFCVHTLVLPQVNAVLGSGATGGESLGKKENCSAVLTLELVTRSLGSVPEQESKKSSV